MEERSEAVVLTEEEYRKIVENKDRIEQMGYKIIDHEGFIELITPQGEKYYLRKPKVKETEVEEVVLPREGKRYKAKIKRIKMGPVIKLLNEKGVNVERLLKRCEELQNPKDKKYCYRRLQDVGYLIEFEVPELEMEDWEVIRFTVHKNSRFRELATCYKVFKKGMEIHVLLTSKGRFKIVCPEEGEEG